MVRTLISLDAADKEWLDEKARAEGLPMTELVRRAIRRYRTAEPSVSPRRIRAALAATKGVWAAGDGLGYQRRIRAEWSRR